MLIKYYFSINCYYIFVQILKVNIINHKFLPPYLMYVYHYEYVCLYSLFSLYCVWVFILHLSVCTCAWYLKVSEEGITSPLIRVTCCEPPWWCWEANIGPLVEQQVFSISGPCLQPQAISSNINFGCQSLAWSLRPHYVLICITYLPAIFLKLIFLFFWDYNINAAAKLYMCQNILYLPVIVEN